MFPRQSLKDILDYFLSDGALGVQYRLFQVNHIVIDTTVLTDVHGGGKEADFEGYNPLDGVTEAAAINAGTNEVKSLGAELTWTKTGSPETAQIIYGVYVFWVDPSAEEHLFAAWNLPSPVSISVAGNEVKATIDWYAKDYAP